ncbi:MAG TPA: ATP-binding protein [Salinivirga sp.]|uniref:ATP-binding protein n=1 Tax=Salinivirga sp. TaxID=1970192 RepID=UPI002B4723F7|nr:ATP-binding protein [Salinivirga sp.]HKK59719.1 ATP-binding protein [Salinivirga sp.]
MRYLNKIVFINSATIPHAEVQLDGNIHFIGTQGVGKSTVLRAILFFYNADSRKLGIPHGPTVKSFVDFYLKYADSYIVYEVVRETGAYCVVAFRSQNRVCFRFIDTAYKHQLFISEAGNAYNNWDAIRENLDKNRVNVSSLVNSYDQYRDILYGNYLAKKAFRKYSLLEAKQYKNIYRTIQNVFLNTKLDANEIKQTIISSMEEEEIAIDLDQYNHHLKGFESELNDIKQFRFPLVQKQARDAIQMLSAIRHLNSEQMELAGQLQFRLELIGKEKPQLTEKREQLKAKHDAEIQKRNYEKELYDKRVGKINDSISQLNGKLKDAAKQKKHYEKLNIEELLKRVATKDDKRAELESLQTERSLLTDQYSSIASKYDSLLKEKDALLTKFINQKEAQKIEIQKDEAQFVADLNAKYEKLYKTLENEHAIAISDQENQLGLDTDNVHKLEKEKLTLKHTEFYADEIREVKSVTNESEFKFKEEQNNIQSYNQQIESLQNKWKYEKVDATRNNEIKTEALRVKQKQAEKEKAEIQDKIQKSKDSLYGWLNENKPGWEHTIGKVIDEALLFTAGLSPKLLNASETIYGVSVNLDEVERNVKTIDDYNFEVERLNKVIDQCQNDLQTVTTSFSKEIENIQKRNLPKIRELKEQVRVANYHCKQLLRKKETANLEYDRLKEHAEIQKAHAIERVQAELDKAIAQKQMTADKLRVMKAKLQKSKENKQREKSRRIGEERAQNLQKIEVLQLQIERKQKEVAYEKEQLKINRNKELSRKGANTDRLSDIEKKIGSVESELSFIDKNRDIVSEYKKDKRELFDREKEFKNEITVSEAKLNHLKDTFNTHYRKISADIEQIEKQIETLDSRGEIFLRDEEKYEAFVKSSAYEVFDQQKKVAPALKTAGTAVQIIDEIMEKYYLTKARQDELKTNIDKFLSHFSDNNIFKFPDKLIGTDAYMEWARELTDFIEEQKIDQFEKRINERFAYIVGSVGKETTMLISKTGEIKKIINKINTDFRQKNFVTAVNNIELDITDSKNTAVTLLRRIKEFNDENALSLGETNLFSGVNHHKSNEKAVELLKQLVKEINFAKDSVVKLADSFELSFRIEENGNSTGWVEKLTNVGSEGTDVLVKAMINIMLLNVFKESASRRFSEFKLHCMMDEIGKLHPTNVKGIMKFANERNILLINGSPTESTPLNYRHIFKISKDEEKRTKIRRIITNPQQAELK